MLVLGLLKEGGGGGLEETVGLFSLLGNPPVPFLHQLHRLNS